MPRFLAISLLASLLTIAARAEVIISYNNTVIAINGRTANPDGYWNSVLDTGLNLQLSLRAQTTEFLIPSSPNDGAGTFFFPVGYSIYSGVKAKWGDWFSINTDYTGLGGNKLTAFDFYLTYDTPAAPGTFRTPFNVLTDFTDNSYGDNATANHAGIVGTPSTSAGLQATYNIAQNAENIGFEGLTPNLVGNYDYQLYAVAAGAGANGTRLLEADMIVQVQATPEPTTLALAGLGLMAMLALPPTRRSLKLARQRK